MTRWPFSLRSRGAEVSVQLFDKPFDPYALLQTWQHDNLKAGSFGATASFVGTMRDFNAGENVRAMRLEHYPGMTEKQLDTIVSEAEQQWPLLDVLIAHRIGDIDPGVPIVLVACWSEHRGAAFDACRFLMEALKSRATFWKKETLADDQARWVAANNPG